MKCNHDDCEITEYYQVASAIRNDGGGGDDEGNTYLRTEVYCPDCALLKTYYKHLPKWLVEMIDERKSLWF